MNPSPTAVAMLLGMTLAATVPASGQDVPDEVAEASSPVDGVDYVVYDRSGSRTSMSGVLAAAARGEVLLVGEEHDDMIGHALEQELLEAAIERFAAAKNAPGRRVVLSLEMFERDVQYVVDEYLAGLISEDHFLRSSRPWDFYDERFRPLVETARAHDTPLIASNAPRRYANLVTREGPDALDALSEHAKGYLPPLPYPGPSETYRAQWDELMGETLADMVEAAQTDSASAAADDRADVPEHVSVDERPAQHERPVDPLRHRGVPEGDAEAADDEQDPGLTDHTPGSNAIYAQALWDAAMGHAITTALVEHLGAMVVHFAGSFHVAGGTGIPERIEDYRPGTRVTTVVMTKVEDIEAWSAQEHADLADFVVLTQVPAEEAEPIEGR